MASSISVPGRGRVAWPLRLVVIAYLVLLVAWPCWYLLRNAFAQGVGGFFQTLGESEVVSALTLTVQVAGIAVLINLVFGVGISLLLVRYDFPGKRLLSALIDLPLSVSPVVVGLALMLVYSPVYGWFGKPLEAHDIQIVFALPGMIMATCFVTLPLVVREIVPVLEELGDDQEQAARSLGAGGWQTFRRITLPGIRWALVYGVVLALARGLGEFGAVKVVSARVAGQSMTATVLVEARTQFEPHTAYAVAFMLAFAGVVALVVVAVLRTQSRRSTGERL